MGQIVTDKQLFEKLIKRVTNWLSEQTTSDNRQLHNYLRVIECTEHEVVRAVHRIFIENRLIEDFSRPDSTVIKEIPSVVDKEKVDIWKFPSDKPDNFVSTSKRVEVSESFRSMPCGYCDASGKLNCPECMGQGTVYCRECRGSGKETCINCKGAKIIDCEICHGQGQVYDNLSGTRSECTRCYGKRRYPCPVCSGKGYMQCSDCAGKMRLPCLNCEGSGNQKCMKCNGKGRILSGLAVEISYKTLEYKTNFKDEALNDTVLKNLPVAEDNWQKLLVLENDSINAKNISDKISNKSIIPKVIELVSSAVVSSQSKILFKNLSIEKNTYYKVRCDCSGKISSIWMSGKDLKIYSETNVMVDIYKDALEQIDNSIKNSKIKDAYILLDRIKNVKSLKQKSDELRKEIRKKLFFHYLFAVIAGLLLYYAISIPIINNKLAGSLYLSKAIIRIAIEGIVVAAFAGLICFLLKVFKFMSIAKRVLLSGAVVVACLFAAFAITSQKTYKIASEYDKNMIQKEYDEYFPYGLRTLANKKDIEFLEKLMKKYSKTKVDMTFIKKDIKWLKSKIKKDKKILKKTEKIRKKIENKGKKKKKKKKRRSRRRYKKRKVNIKMN